jgi:hypothetical protein
MIPRAKVAFRSSLFVYGCRRWGQKWGQLSATQHALFVWTDVLDRSKQSGVW